MKYFKKIYLSLHVESSNFTSKNRKWNNGSVSKLDLISQHHNIFL